MPTSSSSSLPRRRRRFVTGAGIVFAAATSVAGLSVGTINAAGPVPAITDSDVTSAKLGLTLWMVGNIGGDDDPANPLACPILRQDQVGFFMGNAGLAPSSEGYAVDIYYDDNLGGGTPGVSCGPNLDIAIDNPNPATPHFLVLDASTIDGGTATFADVLATYPDFTFTTAPAPGDLGGEIASACTGSSLTLCAQIWHRDGLMIVAAFVGPTADLNVQMTQQLLVSMLPDAVANLIAASDEFGSTTPTVPTVPTVPAVATVPTVTAVTVPAVTVPAVPTLPVVPTVPVSTVPALPTVPVVPTLPAVSTVPGQTVPGVSTVPVNIPPGYTQLVDDTGSVTVAVPVTWTEIDTAADVNADGTPRPYIEAATNIQQFRETFDAPGLALFVDPFVADTATEVDTYGITGGCQNEVIEPFDNGVLSGHIGHWTVCGTTGVAEFHFVVVSPADQSRTISMQVQITGPQEQEALDLALATFGFVTI